MMSPDDSSVRVFRPPSSSSSSSGSRTRPGGRKDSFRHSRVRPKGTYAKYRSKRDSIGGIAYAPAYGYVSEEGRACKSVAQRKIFASHVLCRKHSYGALGRKRREDSGCMHRYQLTRLIFVVFPFLFAGRFTDKDSVSPASGASRKRPFAVEAMACGYASRNEAQWAAEMDFHPVRYLFLLVFLISPRMRSYFETRSGFWE